MRPGPEPKQVLVLAGLNLVALVLAPLLLLKKLHRYVRKRHPHELDLDRWFLPDLRRLGTLGKKRRPRVVFVGPTYGELRIIDVLTRGLETERPDVEIVWCIRDSATIRWVQEAHPKRQVVLWPFENFLPAWKLARLVQPDVLVITEKFWLPNLIGFSKLAGSRIAVVNARTNRRDKLSDRFTLPYYRWITGNVDVFAFQSETYHDRLSKLLSPSTHAVISGNMKLDLQPALLDPESRSAVDRWLSTKGQTPLLAAGSTGPGEDEDFVFKAFEIVRHSISCSLMIAPRKTFRAQACTEIAERKGYRVSVRTRPHEEKADVYVLDTLGELSYAYKFACAAFIGGTVVGTGHNVMEPTLWKIPVSYGPRRGHFEDLQMLCEEYGVGFRCRTPEDLAEHWMRVLTDPKFGSDVALGCERMACEKRRATRTTLDALLPLIDEPILKG